MRVLWNEASSGNLSFKRREAWSNNQSHIILRVSRHAALRTKESWSTEVECFIGNWFAAALACADDVYLLAPIARAMRTMLAVCDKFTGEFNVIFNAKKSKCITFKTHKNLVTRTPTRHSVSPPFSSSGYNI